MREKGRGRSCYSTPPHLLPVVVSSSMSGVRRGLFLHAEKWFQRHPAAGSSSTRPSWPFYRTIFGVRLCCELEEPEGPKGAHPLQRGPVEAAGVYTHERIVRLELRDLLPDLDVDLREELPGSIPAED